MPPVSAPSRATAQGLGYMATGLWPLLHMRSFERVTGPKTDRWLVRTVGLLVTVIGAVLVMAGYRRRLTAEVRVLAAGTPLVLAGVDVYYAARRRISPVYLLDALVEAALAGKWIAGGGARGAASPPPRDPVPSPGCWFSPRASRVRAS